MKLSIWYSLWPDPRFHPETMDYSMLNFIRKIPTTATTKPQRWTLFIFRQLTISSLGLMRSIECRLIACIAALLPADNELVDDVDNVGDAVPVLSPEFGGIGFLIMVTGWVTVVSGPFAMRRCTAVLNESVVMWRSLMCVMSENRLRGKLSHKFGPGPHWQ